MRLSLLPHSISTPFAMTISGEIGGTPDLTAMFVVVTGIIGAIVGTILLTWLPNCSPLARGALLGVGAHGAGTAKAHEFGRQEGSMAGLVMVLGTACRCLLQSRLRRNCHDYIATIANGWSTKRPSNDKVMSDAYGQRLGERMRVDNAPAIVTRELHKTDIAVTEIRCDHPLPGMRFSPSRILGGWPASARPRPPTAKPKIMWVSKRRSALLAACAHPEAKKVSRKTVGRQPMQFSKRALYAMLADAVRNTG